MVDIPQQEQLTPEEAFAQLQAWFVEKDELNKANTEFQTRCSSYPPSADVAASSEGEPAAKKEASAKKPPVPAQKPVASAAASTPAPAVMNSATAAPEATGSLVQPPQP